MESEKAERLRVMLQEAMQPVINRLDRLEQEVRELKKTMKHRQED
ncbi:MAG TPA: hypothetical protein VFJ73_00820 [Bacillales bacterium]|nr:hypothetical protein [Bacillales bacterium]